MPRPRMSHTSRRRHEQTWVTLDLNGPVAPPPETARNIGFAVEGGVGTVSFFNNTNSGQPYIGTIVATRPFTLMASHLAAAGITTEGVLIGWCGIGIASVTNGNPSLGPSLGYNRGPGRFPLVAPVLATYWSEANSTMAWYANGSSKGRRRVEVGDMIYFSWSLPPDSNTVLKAAARLLCRLD